METKSVCFTGKFPEKKSHYYEIVKAKGLEVVEKVTKETDFLVVADLSKGSIKQENAKSYGVTILSIEDFLKE